MATKIIGVWSIALLLGCADDARPHRADQGDESQDGDLGDGDGDLGDGDGDGDGSGDGEEGGACTLERWTSPDSQRLVYSCEAESETEPFVCDCAGTTVTQRPATRGATDACIDALVQTCMVDAAPTFCEERGMGTCWLGANGKPTECRCTGADEVFATSAATCIEGLFSHCASACVTSLGSCTPFADGKLGFDCECGSDEPGQCSAGEGCFRRDARAHASWAGESDCEQAARMACSPPCLHDHGECYAEASGTGVSCVCDGESEETLVSFADLGDDACESALTEHCGPAASTDSCESANGDAHGRCKQGTSGLYDCSCSTGNGDAAGGGYEASSCEALLAQFCPEAVAD